MYYRAFPHSFTKRRIFMRIIIFPRSEMYFSKLYVFPSVSELTNPSVVVRFGLRSSRVKSSCHHRFNIGSVGVPVRSTGCRCERKSIHPFSGKRIRGDHDSASFFIQHGCFSIRDKCLSCVLDDDALLEFRDLFAV